MGDAVDADPTREPCGSPGFYGHCWIVSADWEGKRAAEAYTVVFNPICNTAYSYTPWALWLIVESKDENILVYIECQTLGWLYYSDCVGMEKFRFTIAEK